MTFPIPKIPKLCDALCLQVYFINRINIIKLSSSIVLISSDTNMAKGIIVIVY